ncbi:MAG: SMP-30/gluconolactonase/LRE family protein, partial [Stackebrandtia sp.]
PRRWSDYRSELGEGARWVDGQLIHVDILSGRLLRLSGDQPGDPEVLADGSLPLGAVAPIAGRPGSWIAAVGHGVARLENDGLEWIAEFGDTDTMRVNDAVCDPSGRFWLGTMAYANTPGAGCLYRVDADGSVSKVLSGLTIPNGPAFSPDGTRMYLASSSEARVDVYPVDVGSGELGPPETFVQLEPELSPDGMTVDGDGHLWTAIWDGAAVHRYRPDGTLDRVLSLPTPRPTSCCFGGPGLRRLFVTTASLDLDDDAAGAVYAFDLDITGRPAAAFRPR